MATIGQGVQAGLGRIDYSPYMQGAAAGAQGISQGIGSIGQSVATAVSDYYKQREQKKQEKDAATFLSGFINRNPQYAQTLGVELNLKGEIEDPGVLKPIIKSLGGPSQAIGLATNLQQFEQSQKAFALQQEAAARQAEIDAIKIAEGRAAIAEREARQRDISAATAAYGAVPSTIGQKVVGPQAFYQAPTPNLSEFLYASGDKVIPPVFKATKMPKDLEDFAMRDPNTGMFMGIDRRTVNRFVGEEMQKRATLEAELLKITNQIQQSSATPSISAGRRFDIQGFSVGRLDKQANELKTQINESYKEQNRLLTKVDEFEANKPSLKYAVESLPPSSLINKTVKTVERTIEREASGEEKTAAFLATYVKNGGRITPEFIDKARDAFKSDVSVLDIGDGVTVVRAGNSAQIIDRNKAPSAAQVKDFKAEQYQSMLNQLAAQSDWNSLPLELKQAISSAAAAHEKGYNLLGNRMSGQEAFDSRREALGFKGATNVSSTIQTGRAVAKPTMSVPSGWSVRQ